MTTHHARLAYNASLAVAHRRAAVVLRTLQMDARYCEIAADRLAHDLPFPAHWRRAPSMKRLRVVAAFAAVGARMEMHSRGQTWRVAVTVGTVVRAYILGTPLALKTVTRVLQVGGWAAALAFPMLERAK